MRRSSVSKLPAWNSILFSWGRCILFFPLQFIVGGWERGVDSYFTSAESLHSLVMMVAFGCLAAVGSHTCAHRPTSNLKLLRVCFSFRSRRYVGYIVDLMLTQFTLLQVLEWWWRHPVAFRKRALQYRSEHSPTYSPARGVGETRRAA